MTAIVQAEMRKARFTRSLWALPATGVAVATAGAVLMVSAGKDTDVADRLSAVGALRFGPTNFGLLVLVLGIRVFADETQHRTLSATFIRTPMRARVVAAKAVVAAGIALLFCLAVDVVTIPITAVGTAARGWHLTYDVAPSAAMLGRVALAMALLAVLGVGIGVAVRNRTVAMVAAIVWFALAEDLVGALLHVGRYLPGAAVQGLVSNAATTEHPAGLTSAALLLAYVAAAGVAARVALQRDLT